MQRRRESHTEGLATHGDPESCRGVREGAAEALTGAHAGRVLSREMEFDFQVPRPCLEPKATLDTPDWRGVEGPGAVFSRPRASWKHCAREPGDPAHRPRRMAFRAAMGSQETRAIDARGRGSDCRVVPAKHPNKGLKEADARIMVDQTGTKVETPETAKRSLKSRVGDDGGPRREWREGGRPRGMRYRKARSGRRAGWACPLRGTA